jgi:hypothetical protein
VVCASICERVPAQLGDASNETRSAATFSNHRNGRGPASGVVALCLEPLREVEDLRLLHRGQIVVAQ